MTEQKNKFKEWFYSLNVKDNRQAKKVFLADLEISASTFYYWLGDDYKFSKIQRYALNAVAAKFNGTTIFIEEPKK